ncbi:class I adenylate-forming enzyme family protein [Pseudohaliea rubra]|uniref:Long-chain-fatty-acid--CoA ligase n=1 Tax=Pseudohaliea rubra DSM 19751 TaxID=1265313 RepID=A0A095VRS6_9GAMM|nr:class I adenylate-forming enzyme family protein [Pseudohaliea rubra]KGE04070.1 Long-chain-fatty-acid--CoA ligase [Pseudohaliea rubra DSM 19751]
MDRFPSPAPLLPEILALHGKWRGPRPAVCCAGETLDWAAFCAANHRFAHGLLSRGIAPGDRVGVLMSNGLAMVQTLFGTLAAGAVSVPLNLSVNDEAVVAMLGDAGIRALVVTADLQPRLAALRERLPDSVVLWVSSGPGGDGWETIDGLCAGQPATLPAQALALDPDAPLNIIYSSGTTGLPKGILHTHRGRRDWAYDLAIALRYHGAARTLLTIGLYSNISWVAMLTTLLAGGTLVVHERFDAGAFLDAVEQDGITHTAMVPIQFQRAVAEQRERPRNLSGMHAMMSCGSPLREGLKRDIFAAFPCGIVELYGLTEGIITTLEPEDAEGRWDSVGRPLIGTDIAIIDDDDRPRAAGEAGEIVSRGRITMPGYWNRPQANAEARYVDAAGRVWLRSGDIGYVDDEGFLFIVDRKKDMILSGGQNIYPQDIEAVLVTHPGIEDAGVIAAPSERWGETPLALVVPANPAVDAGELLAWANGELGRQQRLADLLLVDELPRNPNGKMLKRELRERYGDRRYG